LPEDFAREKIIYCHLTDSINISLFSDKQQKYIGATYLLKGIFMFRKYIRCETDTRYKTMAVHTICFNNQSNFDLGGGGVF